MDRFSVRVDALREVVRTMLPAWAPLRATAIVATALLALLWAWIGGQFASGPANPQEFAQRMAAETITAGHLAMPVHPAAEFLETFGVIQEPAYASAYPPGPALLLAIGRWVTGEAAFGAWLGAALLAAACTWMLLGWVRLRWATIGGITAALWGGGASAMAQSFEGWSATALGAALFLGGAVRLVRRRDSAGRSAALALGGGAGWLWLCDPLTLVLLTPAPAIWAVARLWRRPASAPPASAGRGRALVLTMVALVGLLAGAGVKGMFNHAATGHLWQSASEAYAERYRSQPQFLWQEPRETPPAFRHWRMEQYDAVTAAQQAHLPVPSVPVWVERLQAAIDVHASLPVALLIVAAAAVGLSWRARWLLVCAALTLAPVVLRYDFTLGTVAAFFPVALALGVWALRQLWTARRRLGHDTWIVFPVLAISVGLAIGVRGTARTLSKPVAEMLGHRRELIEWLDEEPGKDLVVVRYNPDTPAGVEYVFNHADIDGAEIVWARWTDEPGVALLASFFPGRKLWLLDVLPAGKPNMRPFAIGQPPPPAPSATAAPPVPTPPVVAGDTPPAPSP